MRNYELMAFLLIAIVVIAGVLLYSRWSVVGEKNYMQAYDDTNKEQAPGYKPPTNSTSITVTNSTGG